MKTLHSFLKNTSAPEHEGCCTLWFDERKNCFWLEHDNNDFFIKEKKTLEEKALILSILEKARLAEIAYAEANMPAKMAEEIARID